MQAGLWQAWKQFEAVDATIDEQYDKYAAVLADISEILKKSK